MQFNQITYFLRTCDTLNFTRAAEACHVSQPSLSAAIQKLEDELGGELFVRHGHKISLTPLGLAMRTQLSKIEEAKQSASRVAAEIVHADTGTIDVGLMCTVSPKNLLSAITLFGDEYPQVELLVHDIWETKAQELLLSGALDCIVMAHTVDLPERFVARRLTQEPMLLAMDKSHHLCTRENITLSDLQDFHYVDRLRCEFRDIFFEELGARNLNVQTIMRSERDDLVSESVSQGVGVSIMPQSSANSYGLQTRALSDMNIIRNISMVTVKGRALRPAVQHFIDLISAAYH
ncbi:MAG: LysR family hydrogen peroxide-inducible transcriptional activator [Granulosicoccus sp.]|jgi:LysR family hydrogen peroxide-inducible transcriptional activator